MDVGSWDEPEYLVSSLIKASSTKPNSSNEETRISKALRVTLPDQHHSYYVTESEEAGMKCCPITSISFRYKNIQNLSQNLLFIAYYCVVL